MSAGPVPQYVLFDNSALNYIAGQPQRGFQIGEVDRTLLVDVVRGSVAAGEKVVVMNAAAHRDDVREVTSGLTEPRSSRRTNHRQGR
jgi:hypothetical protein